MKRLLVTATAVVSVLSSASAGAQTSLAAPSATPAVTVIHVPEGTEARIRFEEMVTSKTAQAGDQFAISLAEPIELGNGVVIPAGYKGLGEVTSAERHGFMGKAGQLNVSLDYIKIGDKRVHLRANKGGEGKGSLGSAVALTVLFGPLGLLARGADMTIPAGQRMTAYVEADTDLSSPLAGAPGVVPTATTTAPAAALTPAVAKVGKPVA